MSGKTYNLNEIEIRDDEPDLTGRLVIWNAHRVLDTTQGYTYHNVLEVTNGTRRVFYHIGDDQDFEQYITKNEVKNKLL